MACGRGWCLAMLLFAAGCAPVPALPVSPSLPPPAQRPVCTLSFQDSPLPSRKRLSISFDTVLRLTQDQNGQISLAREKIRQACAEKELAQKRWLPDLYAGLGYYRHEGGIQNEDGTLTHSSLGSLFSGLEVGGRLDLRDLAFQKIDAERRLWQRKGELSQLTSENLLDAAGTYIDLLAARTGAGVHSDLIDELTELLATARKVARVEASVRFEVSRIETELSADRQQLRKSQEQAIAAAAKLAYLLGLDPDAELEPLEQVMTPLPLVDTAAPPDELVARAASTGPGVSETRRILSVLEAARQQGQGAGAYLPTIEMHMLEGAFGAGPGSRSTWDNRWDLGLQVRWNLTDYLTAKERQWVAQSQMNQLHLSYMELKAKLSAGAREAYEAVRSGQDRMREAQAMIEHARETVKWSRYRFTEVGLEKRAAASEVMQALRTLAGARLVYLGALSDYNRAQLRLLVLMGALPPCAATPSAH
jgi:outer membrane protein TolC